jgi:hypothetical protein
VAVFRLRPIGVRVCGSTLTAALAKKTSRRHTKLKPGEKERAKERRDDSMEGWYKRIENNGWRPVSDRVLVDVDEVGMCASHQSS